ncbi:MAG: hypothetical protein M9962_07930 [Oligoflexia bacterium]|nr:hypothetical protein [Oligoflexia bacterium]
MKNELKFRLIASDDVRKKTASFLKSLESCYQIDTSQNFDVPNNDEIFLLLGGDGSLNYFINSLIFSNQIKNEIRVIYFPLGTANDFARSLKIDPTEPSIDCLNAILRKNALLPVPLMLCNDRFFINVASAGSPADITSSGKDKLKDLTGKLSYYISGLEKIINPDLYNLSICADSTNYSEFETHGFLVSQGLYAGGGAKVSSSYSANFGSEFNFFSIKNSTTTEALRIVLQLQEKFSNFSKEDDVLDLYLKTLEVKSEKEIPIKLDGEEYKSKNLIFKKSSQYLSFFLH